MITNKGIQLARIKTIDTTRGMLMLYIVFVIHGFFWLHLLPQFISALLLFEMPAIFIVSGYSYYLYEQSKNGQAMRQSDIKTYSVFLAARSTRILLPYMVYAIFCILYVYAMSFIGDGVAVSLLNLTSAWLNPVKAGQGFSTGMLNWHLWFIPVFLIVTAAMPIVTKFRPLKSPHLLALVLGVALLEVFLSEVHLPAKNIENLIKQSAFYLIFSLFGYYLAHSKEYFRRVNFLTIAFVSLALLVSMAIAGHDIHMLDMQVNKFPPNALFFLFSCLWISLFLFIVFNKPRVVAWFEKLGDAVWLKPFITSGYSIYLWQGAGYTIATLAGKQLGIPILAVWLLALVISVALGLLASPAERVKICFK
jgi:fucose 4-O-acetylase-like acetyltransferase